MVFCSRDWSVWWCPYRVPTYTVQCMLYNVCMIFKSFLSAWPLISAITLVLLFVLGLRYLEAFFGMLITLMCVMFGWMVCVWVGEMHERKAVSVTLYILLGSFLFLHMAFSPLFLSMHLLLLIRLQSWRACSSQPAITARMAMLKWLWDLWGPLSCHITSTCIRGWCWWATQSWGLS